MNKICNKCEIEKPVKDFHYRKDVRKYRNECKSCSHEDRNIRAQLQKLTGTKEEKKQQIQDKIQQRLLQLQKLTDMLESK